MSLLNVPIELPVPVPADDEIQVKVHAVSVNLSDWEFLTGKPYYVRLFGLLRPRFKILGSDVVGTVTAVGPDVTQFKLGDAVFGDIMEKCGGFAEYVCAPTKCWALKPPDMSFEVAATLPQTGCIAVQGIREIGQVQPGEKILINGAGGGSGTLAIPLAKSLGAEVTGVDNQHKQDVMRQVGADHTIDYTTTDPTRTGKTYDLILDLAAYRRMSHWRRALKPGGRYFMVGGSVRLMFKLLLWGPINSRLHRKRMGILGVNPHQDLEGLAQLVTRGTITPIIDRKFPLEEAATAVRLVGEGKAKGKLILTQ